MSPSSVSSRRIVARSIVRLTIASALIDDDGLDWMTALAVNDPLAVFLTTASAAGPPVCVALMIASAVTDPVTLADPPMSVSSGEKVMNGLA